MRGHESKLFFILIAMICGLCGLTSLWSEKTVAFPCVTLPAEASGGDSICTVYVIHESWHTGIVLNAVDIPDPLRSIVHDFTTWPYIEFGWGDSAYYQADDPGIGLALRAVLWPTSSVMQVYGSSIHPANRSGIKSYCRVQLDHSGYSELCKAIAASFALDAFQRPFSTGGWGSLGFFRGAEQYHLFNMCNHWTARMLKNAGLPVSESGAFTAGTVMQRLANTGQAQCPKTSVRTNDEFFHTP